MDENQELSKRSIIITLLIIVIVLLSIALVIAFITRSTIAKNVITFGSLKIELIETTLDETNQERKVDDNDILDITHKPKLSRIVKIKNLGKHDFFARVSLHLVGTDANNQVFDATRYVFYNVNTEDWIYKDGWYYYKKIVKQNDITSNLITGVNFDVNNITSNYPDGKFKLDIKAEAVQAENNAENVLDVLGWPSE